MILTAVRAARRGAAISADLRQDAAVFSHTAATGAKAPVTRGCRPIDADLKIAVSIAVVQITVRNTHAVPMGIAVSIAGRPTIGAVRMARTTIVTVPKVDPTSTVGPMGRATNTVDETPGRVTAAGRVLLRRIAGPPIVPAVMACRRSARRSTTSLSPRARG